MSWCVYYDFDFSWGGQLFFCSFVLSVCIIKFVLMWCVCCMNDCWCVDVQGGW